MRHAQHQRTVIRDTYVLRICLSYHASQGGLCKGMAPRVPLIGFEGVGLAASLSSGVKQDEAGKRVSPDPEVFGQSWLSHPPNFTQSSLDPTKLKSLHAPLIALGKVFILRLWGMTLSLSSAVLVWARLRIKCVKPCHFMPKSFNHHCWALTNRRRKCLFLGRGG